MPMGCNGRPSACIRGLRSCSPRSDLRNRMDQTCDAAFIAFPVLRNHILTSRKQCPVGIWSRHGSFASCLCKDAERLPSAGINPEGLKRVAKAGMLAET